MVRHRSINKEPPSAYDKALELLARREHSQQELRRKLKIRGVASEDATEALFRLEQAHYQSDDRFAETLIRQRIAQGYGPLHIRGELRSHQIVVNGELANLLAKEDWGALAQKMVERRGLSAQSDVNQRKKIAQFLLRRGFPGDVVYRSVGLRSDE